MKSNPSDDLRVTYLEPGPSALLSLSVFFESGLRDFAGFGKFIISKLMFISFDSSTVSGIIQVDFVIALSISPSEELVGFQGLLKALAVSSFSLSSPFWYELLVAIEGLSAPKSPSDGFAFPDLEMGLTQ